MCILVQLREEDGGSRGRNLCLRHSATSRRKSVAVTQRAPEAPLPLLLRPKQRGDHGIVVAGRGAAAMPWCCVFTPRDPASQRGEELATAAA